MNGYPDLASMSLAEIAAMFRGEVDRVTAVIETHSQKPLPVKLIRRKIALRTALLSLRVAMIDEEQG